MLLDETPINRVIFMMMNFPDFPILTEKGVSSEFGSDIKAMHSAETAFLEEQADQRLKRATLSGSRKPKEFCPGDLVF